MYPQPHGLSIHGGHGWVVVFMRGKELVGLGIVSIPQNLHHLLQNLVHFVFHPAVGQSGPVQRTHRSKVCLCRRGNGGEKPLFFVSFFGKRHGAGLAGALHVFLCVGQFCFWHAAEQ